MQQDLAQRAWDYVQRQEAAAQALFASQAEHYGGVYTARMILFVIIVLACVISLIFTPWGMKAYEWFKEFSPGLWIKKQMFPWIKD